MNGTLKKLISALRVKELQECCERLGLRKQGKKSELQCRLVSYINENSMVNGHKESWRVESAERIIKEIYSQMMGTPLQSGPPDKRQRLDTSAGPSNGGSPLPGLADLIEAVLNDDESGSLDNNSQIRCVCGDARERPGSRMIQCDGECCGVWQHLECVKVPLGQEGELYFCELCRCARADPFWEPVEMQIMQPGVLQPTGKTNMANGQVLQVQAVQKQFTIYQPQFELFKRRSHEYKLLAMCLMLNDTVPFRFHWPLNADLRLATSGTEETQYKVYGRNQANKLGANQRDEPANIGLMVKQPGRHRLTLTCADARSFVVLLHLVRQRKTEEVKALMRKPLDIEEAVQRVKEQVHGEGDEDLITTTTVLSLRCPLTGKRMRTPARFSEVKGLVSFDLDAFLELAQKTRKWQCPHSMKNSSVQNLQLDSYTKRILQQLENYPNVTEVEVAPDARWRPAGSPNEPWNSVHDIYAGPCLPLQVKAEPLGDDSDIDSDDEMEELRKAAQAVAAQTRKAKQPEPEVIDLCDSDSDDDRTWQQKLPQTVTSRAPAASAHRPQQTYIQQRGIHPPQQQAAQPQAQRSAVDPTEKNASRKVRLPSGSTSGQRIGSGLQSSGSAGYAKQVQPVQQVQRDWRTTTAEYSRQAAPQGSVNSSMNGRAVPYNNYSQQQPAANSGSGMPLYGTAGYGMDSQQTVQYAATGSYPGVPVQYMPAPQMGMPMYNSTGNMHIGSKHGVVPTAAPQPAYGNHQTSSSHHQATTLHPNISQRAPHHQQQLQHQQVAPPPQQGSRTGLQMTLDLDSDDLDAWNLFDL